ncbi:hypothetical protein TanjilG_19233 [Lupinus angustifolius]|uniref:Cupin type-1 domain-containing protein n=1 Tax=Lupinus angustifolius TaxID=3871 RepID=A0A1J7GIN4_LUPAN|nr:hypothetical protein TanjilG_19233 [Lupinus angustifolius]
MRGGKKGKRESKSKVLAQTHTDRGTLITSALKDSRLFTEIGTAKSVCLRGLTREPIDLRISKTTALWSSNQNLTLSFSLNTLMLTTSSLYSMDFYPSSTKDQQSYFSGFSRNTLEATFNSRYKEIQRILLGNKDEHEDEEQSHGQEQSHQEEGVIVRVSKEQIQELRKHAQSLSGKGKPSKSGPFNLRSNEPIYSNKFGNFYEITPDRNPQAQYLDISLTFIDINEAIFVVVVDEGEGNYELVGIRDQQQQQDEQEVRRYNGKLTEGDIFVIPTSHPISISTSSNIRLLGFGINAYENQRNFLVGSKENVIRQLDREVKELTFPGSAEDIERLIKNQQQSYFANAQPQQQQQKEKEGSHGRRGLISSI